MAYKQSNPIQQRMELLLEKWEVLMSLPANIIRIHPSDNEKQMVSSFYTYLLGIETKTDHIPIIFESIYHNHDQYSNSLLKELSELIEIWNHSNKEEIKINTEQIQWKVDFDLKDKENPAYTFIENINRLINYMCLEDCCLVAILRVSFVQPKQFNRWLEFALEAEMQSNFKIIIDDSMSHTFYDDIAQKFPDKIMTLIPDLDMDNAMKQVSALGNPNDPAVEYRKAFILLMQAIEKRKEKDTEKHAATCIEIAIKNIKKNPYWLGQIIAVYAALGNDQVGYKNYKKAIAYSTYGVQAAEKSKALIPDEFMQKKFIAQAVMLRASLYSVDKQWDKAIGDFKLAAIYYAETQDFILAIEAYRMIGYSARKNGDNETACQSLLGAIKLSKSVPVNMIKYTSFAGVIELLLECNFYKYITFEEIEEFVKSIYGEDWLREIKNWKNPSYDPVDNATNVMMQ